MGGGPAGDLLLKIELAPDPRFRIDGSDILTYVALTPPEAVLGGEADVETPGGTVRLRIPARSSSGRKIRLARARAGAGRRRPGSVGRPWVAAPTNFNIGGPARANTMDMNRLTQKSQEALQSAQTKALQRLKDEYVSVEHLLLAMIDEGSTSFCSSGS
jgi:DnaJ-class molecular chaperone